MDHMSLLSLLLISMPEAVLITMLGFQLTGLKATLPQLLVIGTVQAILSYFIRLSPLPFGLHSIVHIVLYIFVLRIVTGIFFRAIIIAALLGSTIFVSLEAVILPTLLSLTGYSLSEVINSQSIRITFFLPEAAAILIIIIACNQYNFSLLDFSPGVNQLVEKSSKTSIWEKSSFNLYVLVLLPVQLLAILNLVLYVSQTGTFPNKYFSLFIALFSLVVGTITVLSMGAVKRISELKEKELEAQKARETIAQLDKIIRAIRKQRHDFNHHL